MVHCDHAPVIWYSWNVTGIQLLSDVAEPRYVFISTLLGFPNRLLATVFCCKILWRVKRLGQVGVGGREKR